MTEGVSNVSWVLAFLAGVISFLSPCVLPLIPGYISL
ncbi:MAG: cytochrome c biogenesis protein CcdA, partial [Thermodesulfobacteriota bacterium]